MKKFDNFILYFRHISFIAFLWAGVILFPAFKTIELGKLCFGLFLVYSIITFVLFFVKSNSEQYNLLNNIVLCFLHIYFCFIAYKYSGLYNLFGIENDIYFEINFIVSSICIFVLTINKLILVNSK